MSHLCLLSTLTMWSLTCIMCVSEKPLSLGGEARWRAHRRVWGAIGLHERLVAAYEVQCGMIRGTGGMIRGPVWHNTRSLPIGFTVAAQYEVPCGTIRGPMRHDTRSSAAQYEVLCGTIRGPVLRHDTRSWIQNLGPNFFS